MINNRFLSGIFASTVVCVLLSTSGVGLCSNTNGLVGSRGSKSVATGNEVPKDSNGPTILLGYSKEGFKKNLISSFMYFIPLISPTLVDRETSANNEQQVGIVKYERRRRARSWRSTSRRRGAARCSSPPTSSGRPPSSSSRSSPGSPTKASAKWPWNPNMSSVRLRAARVQEWENLFGF